MGSKSGRTKDVQAPNNWWGTADIDKINKLIFDFNDDPKERAVKIIPIATKPHLLNLPKSDYTRQANRATPSVKAKPALRKKTRRPTAKTRPTAKIRKRDPARGKLGLAKNYLSAGKKEKAKALLREIVEKHSESPHATEAKELLNGL